MPATIVNAHCPFDYALFGGAVCVIGVFDGVHIGHRYLVEEAKRDASARNCRCVIITFSQDPDELFNATKLHKLQTNAHRINMLATLGASSVAVLPFDEAFAKLTPMQFLQKIFRRHTPASIHVGCDFRFGKGAIGDVSVLKEWGEKTGCEIFAHDLYKIDGEPVTSTRIRHLIEQGENKQANELLGVKMN